MYKLKKHIVRRYVVLGICLMSFGVNSFNASAQNVQINKMVTSKYQESYNIKNTDIKENSVDIKEVVQTSSNTVNETPIKPEEGNTNTSNTQKNQKSLGTPIKAELTAYCNDPRCIAKSKSSEPETAMQTKTRVGVVAAPANIPLGSKLYIPELTSYKADGMFDVEDRGGAIKVKKDGTYVIDVWVPTYEDAINFGRKNTTIYLIE